MIKLVWKKYCFLIIVVIAFALLSFSNRVGLGPWNLTIPLPDILLNFFGIVRSSSRLFWPMYYIIILLIIFVIVRSYRLKSAIYIFTIAALIQVIDTSAGWLPIREKVAVAASSKYNSTLQNPIWQMFAKKYQIIVANNGNENWGPFGMLASANQMSTNITYLARVDFKKMIQSFASVNQQLQEGPLDLDALYVLQDWKIAPDRISFDPKIDLLARIDGINILAPGWKTCITCLQVSPDFELAQLAPPLNLGEVVEFTKSGNGRTQFMLGGWGFTEEWGTWATDSLAKVILPMPKGDPEKLIIQANAFLSPQHTEQIVDIAVNGVRVADHIVLSKTKGNTLELKLPRGPKEAGEPVTIEFRSLNAISPRDAGLGADDRKLGIGLVSIQFVR